MECSWHKDWLTIFNVFVSNLTDSPQEVTASTVVAFLTPSDDYSVGGEHALNTSSDYPPSQDSRIVIDSY